MKPLGVVIPIAMLVLPVFSQSTSIERYFPPARGEWATETPESLGWNKDALEQVFDYAAREKSTGLVILHDGRLVAERYWQRADVPRVTSTAAEEPVEDVASLQKSFVSMLMGIAVDRGLLDRRAPVSKYLGPGWSHAGVDAERAITVNHLLTMTSGLNDALEFASPAGSVWHYNTPAYSQLIGVLAAVTRKDVNDYSAEWLTSAIGMTDTRWIKRQSAFPNPYGLATTARDMARMGLLVLRNGAWAGKQIVSEAYVREAIRSSQTLNPSYGLLWWTNRHVPGSSEPTLATNVFAVPAAPSDLVAGLGAADRKVYVVPSRQLVIVRLGAAVSGPGRRFDREVWERLASAIH